jgi:predicted ATPase/DNA-binding CsgD family transcriptional regulator
VVEVAPLAVPEAMPATPVEALGHPAVALFVDRAASVLPGFALDERTLADVVELCRRLDGIPLAIELAAVRLRVLSVRQLLDRVEDRFAVLTDGDRAGPARHRTLQATIAWSHELCTPTERALWSRAGVFPGAFDLDALDAVCTDAVCTEAGPTDVGIPSAALLDGVTGLAAKSILVRDEDQGEVRFRMLETVREFGHDQLPAELDGPLRTRHRDHYLAVAEALARGWFGPDQDAWSRRMKAELANLRAALDHSLREPGGGLAALRLVGAPRFLWATSLSMTEHRRWLQRALTAAPQPSRERVQALVTCALVASLQGDQPTAATLAKEGLELARDLGDEVGTAYATHLTGMVAFFSDEFPRAAELLAEGERRYRATGGPPDLTGALDVHIGLLNISRDLLDEAQERLAATRERSEAAGEAWVRSYAIDGLGFIALLRGELGTARRLARESLELTARFDDTVGLSLALDLAAWTAAAGEEHERAAILLGAASARWRSFGQQLYGSPDWQARRDGYQQRARGCLGDPTFEAAFRHGAAMSRPDMLGYALGARRQPALPGPLEVLTAREREIARLVAEGLTNRQIAARLVVSHRTVEGHVGRILGKLGFGRRAQLAAWVGRGPPP